MEMEVASGIVLQGATRNTTTVPTMRGILGAHRAKLSGCKLSCEFFQKRQDKISVLSYTKDNKWQSTKCECEPQVDIKLIAFCRHIQATMEVKVRIGVPNKP